MKTFAWCILFLSLGSCNSVDPATKKEIRSTWDNFINSLLTSDNNEVIKDYCTFDGFASLSRHFQLNTQKDLKELAQFFKEKEISGFEKIDNTEKVKVLLGEYNAVTGRLALVFVKENDRWKIDKYLAGK